MRINCSKTYEAQLEGLVHGRCLINVISSFLLLLKGSILLGLCYIPPGREKIKNPGILCFPMTWFEG